MGAINSIAQVVEHPQVQARGTLVDMNHPRAGKVRMVGAPVRLSATPGAVRTPAPMLGEHTDEVLGQLLGLGASRSPPFAQRESSAPIAETPRSVNVTLLVDRPTVSISSTSHPGA
jgi:hypothetical protein